MLLSNKTIGFALTGSFCCFEKALIELEKLQKESLRIIPIMSEIAYTTSTRFGEAESFVSRIEDICGEKVIHTISGAEPIGPKKLLDLLVICPCTGNTMAKLKNAITDTPVTMAAKAHLRNERPLVIAPSTNDALGASGVNILSLMNSKNVYFVPFGEDDPEKKPKSLVAHFDLLIPTIEGALSQNQIQPIIF